MIFKSKTWQEAINYHFTGKKKDGRGEKNIPLIGLEKEIPDFLFFPLRIRFYRVDFEPESITIMSFGVHYGVKIQKVSVYEM